LIKGLNLTQKHKVHALILKVFDLRSPVIKYRLLAVKTISSFLILSILLLSGCTSSPERIPGFLYLRLSSDITTLDPAMIVDVAGGSVAAKIFNGLVRFDEESRIVPDLAEGFSISEDGKTYKFRLRKGVRFHNGTEFKAKDVKYSFERVLSPETRSSRTWLFDRISGAKEFMNGTSPDVQGIRVLDEYTVELEIMEPFGPFLSLLAMPPAYIVPLGAAGREFSSNPIGTGPFSLKEWRRGRELILSTNVDYFSEKAEIKGLVYRIIPEELTTIAEFESGNLDIIGVPSTEFRRYSESSRWSGQIQKSHGLNIFYLGFNCQKAPFNVRKVRQALNYAIDRDRILKTILEGRGELATGPIPHLLLQSWNKGYRYDPEMARALLKESGLENKLKFRIYQPPEQDTVDIMEVVQQYLKGIGVEAEIVQLEWSAFKDAINKGEADSFWLSWRADYPDPENFLFPVFHSSNWGSAGNRARFKDPEIDRLIEEAQIEPDEKKRTAIYIETERLVIEDAPWLFFWHKNEYIVHQPWVKGVKAYSIYNADKGTGVLLSEKR
jgi:peptide/nickel transport system substrate-binding protein/oligopeptide transport system substrate-binding protein